MLLCALALLCFPFIISPTLWVFSLEVEVAQLTIQQADVSFAPAKYLGKQTQSWRGCVGVTARDPSSLQGTSGEEGMLRAGWSRGLPCTLGAGCTGERCWLVRGCRYRTELSPKDSMGRKARKTSSGFATGAGTGTELLAAREDPCDTGSMTAPRSTSPQLKGDHLVTPGGQGEPDMELPPLQPLCLCARCRSWSQRDSASPPGALCHPRCDGWCLGLIPLLRVMRGDLNSVRESRPGSSAPSFGTGSWWGSCLVPPPLVPP